MSQIRNVPADWQHPMNSLGTDFACLRGYGWSFEDMCQEAIDNQEPEFQRAQWWGTYIDGRPCTHFQVYEEFTKGTPV